MKVLMFSLEKKLLAPLKGDLSASQDLDRHIAYSEQVDKLTTIVVAKGNFRHQYVTPTFETYPTQAGPLGSFFVLKHYTRQVLKHEDFDLIVAQDVLSFYAYLIAKKLKKPFFVTVHGAWWDEDKPFRSWWRSIAFFLITFAIKRALGVRVVSEGIRKDLTGHGVDPKRIVVIPPPVDISIVGKEKKRDVVKLQKQYKGVDIVLYDGRFEEEKNVLFLLEVARRLSEAKSSARIVLVGKGSQQKKLVDMAIEMGIFKQSIDVVDGYIDDMPAWYTISKVFVMPSFSESFNKAIVKASAAGLPIVAIKNLGTSTTVLDGKTGYLLERGDSQGFVKKIQLLLSQEDKRASMGVSGKAFVAQTFNYLKSVVAIPDAWKVCVGEKASLKQNVTSEPVIKRTSITPAKKAVSSSAQKATGVVKKTRTRKSKSVLDT